MFLVSRSPFDVKQKIRKTTNNNPNQSTISNEKCTNNGFRNTKEHRVPRAFKFSRPRLCALDFNSAEDRKKILVRS